MGDGHLGAADNGIVATNTTAKVTPTKGATVVDDTTTVEGTTIESIAIEAGASTV